MDSIEIFGGQPLNGEITIQGSKNAALPMMAAALLHEGVVVLENCPKITDVYDMIHILEHIGVKVSWKLESLIIDSSKITSSIIPKKYAQRMRSSIVLMASILIRTQNVCMPYPGGCVIGQRPIDLHKQVLESFGAEVEENQECLSAFAQCLHGTTIHFPKKSVGATEHAIMAGVLAEGVSIIENAAGEPEIISLCKMLKAMGGKITGEGTNRITIIGVKQLYGAKISVPVDRIVAGTYLLAGAITRGKITFLNPPLEELSALLEVYQKMGGQYEVISGKLSMDASNLNMPITYLETKEYPGFPTDLQSTLMSVLSTIPGKSILKETIFEDRFHTSEELCKMGADIIVKNQQAVITGVQALEATTVYATDLRGGAALVLAGLFAKGKTVVLNYHFIERGYVSICEDLNKLGGKLLVNKGEDNENQSNK